MSLRRAATARILSVIGLFSILLAYFVFTKAWYAPAALVVQGTASEKKGELEVSWDSGAGWNTYEKRVFPIQRYRSETETGKLPIRVRPLGEKNPASLSSEVVCSRIMVDGKEIDLNGIDHTGRYQKDGIHLSAPKERIRFSVSAVEHIYIELLTNNHSGKAEISVSNDTTFHDLYIANEAAKSMHFDFWFTRPDGRFTIKMPMPRYKIKTLQVRNRKPGLPIHITAVSISCGEEMLPLNAPSQPRLLSAVRYQGLNKERRQYFLPSRFALQAIFAALTTWLFMAVYRWINKGGGSVKALFSGDRYLFWIFFIGAAGIYSLWLVAFWPGVMSVDSLKVWRAALLPDIFINDHPFFFVLLYTFLQHLWHHPAVVPLFHILTVSGLISYILHRLYRENLPLWGIVPVYIVLVFSIPIGLYNVVLWKDIPFAILVIFWAFMLSFLFRKRRSGQLRLSFHEILAFFLLYLAVGLIRHNGLLYLAVIPAFLIGLRIISVKTTVVTLAYVLLFVVLGWVVFQTRVPEAGSGFLAQKASQYEQHLKNVSLVQEGKRTFRQYWGILNITQTRSKWDLWHYYLGDRQAYWFLLHSGWWDAYPYIAPHNAHLPWLKKLGMKLYWNSYKKPWVYLSWNPVFLMALFPLPILLFRWFPCSAIYSAFILAQVLALLGIIGILNWRYYYFFYFGLFFLPLLMLWDVRGRRSEVRG